MKIILAIVVLILLFVLLGQFAPETFHPIRPDNTSMQGVITDYYQWRAYQPNPRDVNRLKRFPFTYQPLEHPAKFDKYLPYFYEYGYGSF